MHVTIKRLICAVVEKAQMATNQELTSMIRSDPRNRKGGDLPSRLPEESATGPASECGLN